MGEVKCRSCGGTIKILPKITIYKCQHCSATQVILERDEELDFFDRIYKEEGSQRAEEERSVSNKSKDAAAVFEAEKRAAEKGAAWAQFNLGLSYQRGQGCLQDDKQAAEWFLKAAEQGDKVAQYQMGWMCEHGRGVPQSYEKAMEWYLKAAESTFPNLLAQRAIGLMYEYGNGVEKDYQKAEEWYTKAAEYDCERAQYNLGWLYANVKEMLDYEKAYYWYHRAAERELYPPAQCELGRLYEFGYGVEKDCQKAYEWYEKAANQGNTNAMNNIGNLYLYGKI